MAYGFPGGGGIGGLSLDNFVANQYWMTSIFSPSVVGLANGISAGWANTRAAAAQFLMPQIHSLLSLKLSSSAAWWLSFLIPGIFQLVMAALVLVYGRGRDRALTTKSAKLETETATFWDVVVRDGLGDYREWILGLAYACSFGSELTTDNMVAGYFSDRFGLDLRVAGTIAAAFSLTKLPRERPTRSRTTREKGNGGIGEWVACCCANE